MASYPTYKSFTVQARCKSLRKCVLLLCPAGNRHSKPTLPNGFLDHKPHATHTSKLELKGKFSRGQFLQWSLKGDSSAYTLSMAEFLPKWQRTMVRARDQMPHGARNMSSLVFYRSPTDPCTTLRGRSAFRVLRSRRNVGKFSHNLWRFTVPTSSSAERLTPKFLG